MIDWFVFFFFTKFVWEFGSGIGDSVIGEVSGLANVCCTFFLFVYIVPI